MRLTCLACGHQLELPGPQPPQSCICGRPFVYPTVVDTGVQPGPRAAERARLRAFRAAGLVKNSGGVALGVALLGLLCFPLGLLGAAGGAYVLVALRGPLGRYSGRHAALWAVVVGLGAFFGEGSLVVGWLRRSPPAAELSAAP